MGRKHKTDGGRYHTAPGYKKRRSVESEADAVVSHLEWAKRPLTGDAIVYALTHGGRSTYTDEEQARAGIREAVRKGWVEPVAGGEYRLIGKVVPVTKPWDRGKTGTGLPALSPAHRKHVKRHRPGFGAKGG